MPPIKQIAKVLELKQPFQVVSAPYTRPKENQIVVKSAAVAINPIDYELQDVGKKVLPHVTFPLALGFDVAGEVVEVGSKVSRFKVGDRVVGVALGPSQTVDDETQSAFQLYVVLLEHLVAKIPDNISYERASVLPLGLNTAACALFDPDHLNLDLPTPVKQKPKGQTLLVWGASSSVGLNAVQLAVSAGYEVFATSSPRNFSLVKRVGASRVFDYRSPTVVTEIIAAYEGKTTAGAIAMGLGSMDALFDILNKNKRGHKFIAMATFPVPEEKPRFLTGAYVGWYIMTSLLSYAIKSRTRGIKYKFVVQDETIRSGIGKAIWQDYLGEALANGTLVPEPEPLVVGKGLDKIQEGIDKLKKGVSARKLIVTL